MCRAFNSLSTTPEDLAIEGGDPIKDEPWGTGQVRVQGLGFRVWGLGWVRVWD